VQEERLIVVVVSRFYNKELNSNFACCFVWVRMLVARIEVET